MVPTFRSSHEMGSHHHHRWSHNIHKCEHMKINPDTKCMQNLLQWHFEMV